MHKQSRILYFFASKVFIYLNYILIAESVKFPPAGFSVALLLDSVPPYYTEILTVFTIIYLIVGI